MIDKSKHDMVVLLNENARRVTARVMQSLQQLIPYVPFYSARTMEEGRRQVREALDRGCKRLICGGGDGTMDHVFNQVREYVDEQNAKFQALSAEMRQKFDKFTWPKIGILKLGTGNGLAGVVGSKKPSAALLRLKEDENLPTTSIHLVEGDDRIFHFAGMGYDAAVLNDYYLFKQRFGQGILAPWFKTLAGYLTSMIFKTIPENIIRRDKPVLRVTSGEGGVFSVSRSKGLNLLTDEPGRVIYEGPANIVGAATTPNYGYGLRAFPYAFTKKGFFNFRIITSGVVELVTHAKSIWTGAYESPTFIDFLAKDVHVEFDRPMPFQIGGDPQGYRENVHFSITDFCVDVFNFSAA